MRNLLLVGVLLTFAPLAAAQSEGDITKRVTKIQRYYADEVYTNGFTMNDTRARECALYDDITVGDDAQTWRCAVKFGFVWSKGRAVLRGRSTASYAPGKVFTTYQWEITRGTRVTELLITVDSATDTISYFIRTER